MSFRIFIAVFVRGDNELWPTVDYELNAALNDACPHQLFWVLSLCVGERFISIPLNLIKTEPQILLIYRIIHLIYQDCAMREMCVRLA